MAETMNKIAAGCLLLFILCLALHLCCGSGFTLALCITLGTTAYHFWMRLAVGYAYDRLMQNRAILSRRHWQLRPWEKKLYNRLKVKSWKAKMPSYSPELFSPQNHSWSEIAQAMCQAELVHLTIIPLSFLPLLATVPWGAFWVFLISSLAAAAYDSLFVIMQRYNRPRIVRIIEKEKQ